MSHARDLLLLLLSSNASATDPNPAPALSLPTGTLTSTTVSRLPDIPSVQAFDAKLVVGGKDIALRKASSVLKSASESMSRVAAKNARYWTEALEIRRHNWDMVPAPLPLGSATGKGADRTSRDFLICFGLEECTLCSADFCVRLRSDEQKYSCVASETRSLSQDSSHRWGLIGWSAPNIPQSSKNTASCFTHNKGQ